MASGAQPADVLGKRRKRLASLRQHHFTRLDQMGRDLKKARECCANWSLNPTWYEQEVMRFLESVEMHVWKHRDFDENTRLQHELEDILLPPLQTFRWYVKQFGGTSPDTLERWSRLFKAWKQADRQVQSVYGPREDLDL